jgi:hypothetical protein
VRAKEKPLDEPPTQVPSVTSVNVTGYAILRQRGRLQPAGGGLEWLRRAHELPNVSVAEVYTDVDDARAAAREALTRAFAAGAPSHAELYVVAVVIKSWRARDFRTILMPGSALEVAADRLTHGAPSDAWWQVALESEAGVLLPWGTPVVVDDSPKFPGFFVFMRDDAMQDCLELGEPVEPGGTVTFDSLLEQD